MRTAIFYRTEGEVEWKLLYNGGKIVTSMEVAKDLLFTDPRFNVAHLVQMSRYEDIMKEEKRKLNPKSFTLNDLETLPPSVHIRSLSEDIVDEKFASDLQAYLKGSGVPVHWTSLDDMGFISIFFGDKSIEVKEEWLKIIVDGINKLYNKI